MVTAMNLVRSQRTNTQLVVTASIVLLYLATLSLKAQNVIGVSGLSSRMHQVQLNLQLPRRRRRIKEERRIWHWHGSVSVAR